MKIYFNINLIFILIILLILYLIIYNLIIDPFTFITDNFIHNKGLLVLFGESFREGTQGTRLRDTENSYNPQKLACESHIEFCNYIKQIYNVNMDILINTYDTKYENDLKSWYTNYNLSYMTNPELLGNNNIAQQALNTVNTDNYDFVLITRIDILLKPYFFNIFNPYSNKVNFICNNWTLWHTHFEYNNINFPCVNPTIIFIPKKYFKILSNINIEHDAWVHYYKNFNMHNDDMGFMVDYYHDADSYKDYNPYYKMVSRPETYIWYDRNKK